MTVVRLQNTPLATALFNNSATDLFGAFSSLNTENRWTAPPVNILEKTEEYIIEVVVPGLTKEVLSVSIDKNVLTIAAEPGEPKTTDEAKVIGRGFSPRGFKRSFTLDDGIDAAKISAEYVNGVLTINLAKKQEVKPTTKQISIQ